MSFESERQRLSGYFQFGQSVDCVVFGFDGEQLQILVIERGAEPFFGYEALPGDLVRMDEDIDEAATRILHDLTGLDNVFLDQLKTFGAVGRHPLGRVVTTAFFSLINQTKYNPRPASWAVKARWKSLSDLAEMAFDHREILQTALEALQRQVRQHPIGFELLPEEFTLAQLQGLYEAVLDTQFDKANFRKKILSMEVLKPLDKVQKAVRHRPARLYRFDTQRYHSLAKQGFLFEL
ncbi:MAG: NUDIX hydrolase [Schleiferiaceae bacterium]